MIVTANRMPVPDPMAPRKEQGERDRESYGRLNKAVVNRELTQGGRRCLRERQKTSLMNKNQGSARLARAFCILVHFFAALALTKT